MLFIYAAKTLQNFKGSQPDLSIDKIPANSGAKDPIKHNLPEIVRNNHITEEQAAPSKTGAPKDGEEVVDLETFAQKNGDVKLKFSSHGKQHELDLTASRQQFANFPVKIIGSSPEQEEEVNNELKVGNQYSWFVQIYK